MYGEEFDSNQYLKRFFSRKAQLAEPDIKHYLNAIDLEEKLRQKGLDDLTPYPIGLSSICNTTDWLIHIAKAYNIDIRSLDQLIAKLEACIKAFAINMDKHSHLINIPVLITALIEHDYNRDSFYKREDFKNVPTDLTSDYKVDTSYNQHDTYLRELINISFQILTRTTIQNSYGRPQVVSAFNIDDFNRLRDSYQNERVMMDFLNQCVNKLNAEADSKLRWSDYKKVIELAGNLE